MTDRELLEAAAKAVGLPAFWDELSHSMRVVVDGGRWYLWRPLTDDGDALRLAVKLHISIEHPDPADNGSGYVTASLCRRRYRHLFLKRTWFNVTAGSEECPGDLLAATRRAIVRAAAAIGSAA